MLETISESRSAKDLGLPPRMQCQTSKTVEKLGKFGDDQDPTFGTEDDDYAKSYSQMQLKRLYTKAKETLAAPVKVGSGSPASDNSDSTFVCDMTSAQEPLYGDEGEEDFWK